MRRRSVSANIDLPPLRLHLDEIGQVVDLLRQHSDKVRISTQEYELEDVAELTKLGDDHLHYLWIRTSSPSVDLQLNIHYANISSGDDPAAKGLASDVHDIVLRGKRPLLSLIKVLLSFRSLAAMWVFFILPSIAASMGLLPGAFSWLALPVLAVGIPAGIVGFWNFMGRYSTVVLSYRREAPSFWKRNRDELAVNTVVALLSIVGTLAITRWMDREPADSPAQTSQTAASLLPDSAAPDTVE